MSDDEVRAALLERVLAEARAEEQARGGLLNVLVARQRRLQAEMWQENAEVARLMALHDDRRRRRVLPLTPPAVSDENCSMENHDDRIAKLERELAELKRETAEGTVPPTSGTPPLAPMADSVRVYGSGLDYDPWGTSDDPPRNRHRPSFFGLMTLSMLGAAGVLWWRENYGGFVVTLGVLVIYKWQSAHVWRALLAGWVSVRMKRRLSWLMVLCIGCLLMALGSVVFGGPNLTKARMHFEESGQYGWFEHPVTHAKTSFWSRRLDPQNPQVARYYWYWEGGKEREVRPKE